MRRSKSSNPVVLLVREFLAQHPHLVEAAREQLTKDNAQQAKRDAKAQRIEDALAGRLSERYAVRGTWTAEEVEPYLAAPRSSLNAATFGPNYFDIEKDL